MNKIISLEEAVKLTKKVKKWGYNEETTHSSVVADYDPSYHTTIREIYKGNLRDFKIIVNKCYGIEHEVHEGYPALDSDKTLPSEYNLEIYFKNDSLEDFCSDENKHEKGKLKSLFYLVSRKYKRDQKITKEKKSTSIKNKIRKLIN